MYFLNGGIFFIFYVYKSILDVYNIIINISLGGNRMDINELRLMQNYPLELKIMKTKLRIEEWVSEYGVDGVYVAFSGGKDSTVLLHIVRSLYPNIEGVFANTGNEFPEIVQFVRKQENIKYEAEDGILTWVMIGALVYAIISFFI